MAINPLHTSVFAMSFLSNDDKVRRETRRIFSDSDVDMTYYSPVRTKFSAASFRPQHWRHIRDAAQTLDVPMREAAAQGSCFIAFPELSALALLGLLPKSERVVTSLFDALDSPDTRREVFSDAVQTAQGFLGEVFFNLFSELARGHRMFVAAGGFYVLENEEIYNRQYLFSDNGEILGQQDKLILSPLEREVGVSVCSRLAPIETGIGRIALLTASCAPHYEPFAVAAAAGCRAVVAGASPFFEDTDLLHARAWESGIAVISPGIEESPSFHLMQTVPPDIILPSAEPQHRSEVSPERGTHSVTVRADLSAMPVLDNYTADRSGDFFRELLKE